MILLGVTNKFPKKNTISRIFLIMLTFCSHIPVFKLLTSAQEVSIYNKVQRQGVVLLMFLCVWLFCFVPSGFCFARRWSSCVPFRKGVWTIMA